MSRETWRLIKQSNRFYIQSYRGMINALLISILLNIGLGIFFYASYFSRPEPDFYATNGETPPLLLTPLVAANNSSVALLANDPDNGEVTTRVIPQ